MYHMPRADSFVDVFAKFQATILHTATTATAAAAIAAVAAADRMSGKKRANENIKTKKP